MQTASNVTRYIGRQAINPRAVQILYEDKGLIVVNKPSGLVCQSDNSWSKESGRLCSFDALLKGILVPGLQLDSDPFQVHRLDKHTTGALLLAKSTVSVRALSQQFQSHTIKKTYLAIVRGGRKTFQDAAKGTISIPLRVTADGVKEDERNGMMALTDWELLGSSDKVPLSLLRLQLHSGIKHQLRVHLANGLHAPILGDTLYSSKPPTNEIINIIPRGITVSQKWRNLSSTAAEDEYDDSSKLPSTKGESRVFLHASHIGIFRFRSSGPSKRLLLGISAPLPRDYLSVCDAAGLTHFLTARQVQGGLTIDGHEVPLDAEISGICGRWIGPRPVPA